MNVCHINTFEAAGGAARAANRLHKGLLLLGHNSTMLVTVRQSSDPTVRVYSPPSATPSLRNRIIRRLTRDYGCARRLFGCELFSVDRVESGTLLPAQLPRGGIVNLHWVAGYLDYRSFFPRVTRESPVVWTLHDMNAFTGGCHFDAGCGKYQTRCGTCPQLGSLRENDLSRQVWLRKQTSLQSVAPARLHVVAPSQWLAAAARNSPFLRKHPVSVIPYGLDTDAFAPRDRTLARSALGIPAGAKVVLFVAQSVVDQRKGFAVLTQTLERLQELPNLFLISVGSGEVSLGGTYSHLHLGNFENDRLLSLVYSAADVFVVPSLQDNLPNTVMESLACGTPVVGFKVGGIPDMVRPGLTGLLATAGDVGELSDAIAAMLNDPERREEMSANCRRIAVNEYALETQARRYVQLYESMVIDTAATS